MRHVAARFARLCAIALVFGSIASSTHAATDDRYQLEFLIGRQFDRYQSPQADSLGLSLTNGVTAGLAFDFRVMDAPMGAARNPALHVHGRALTAQRTFSTAGSALTPSTAPPIEESPSVEIVGGIALSVPMSIVDPGAGSALYLGYEAGITLARHASYGFIELSRFSFGFERTAGFFDGSLVEMAYGRNEIFGQDYAAQRWAARFRVQGRLGPFGTQDGEAGSVPTGSPVRAFVDLAVDTDGGDGPDGIQVLMGLSLNAGSVLQRMMSSAP